MANTKRFKNGNSQAVRIPAELACSMWDVDLVIERHGLRPSMHTRPRPMVPSDQPTKSATAMPWTSSSHLTRSHEG